MLEKAINLLILIGLTVISIRQRTRQEMENPMSALSKECQRLALYDMAVFGLWLMLWMPRIIELPAEIGLFRLEYYYALALGLFFGVDYWARYSIARKKELAQIRAM